MGIAVSMKAKRPLADVVIVDGNYDSPQIFEEFTVTCHSSGGLASQIHDLATAIRTRATGLKPDRVVVRRADRSPMPRNQEGPRARLLAEGAIVSAAADQISDVILGMGKELGDRSRAGSKEALDAYAISLNGARPEATAAALAGL
jgi:hypothetical protein